MEENNLIKDAKFIVFFKLVNGKYITESGQEITTEIILTHENYIFHDKGHIILKTLHSEPQSDLTDKWISVEERLPENDLSGSDSIFVLVYGNQLDIVVRPFNLYHQCWDDEDADDYFCDAIGGKISHWMPLPKKP